MSSARMTSALGTLRQQIETRQQARRAERIEKGKQEREISGGSAMRTGNISPDVHGFFSTVMATVNLEKNRYLNAAAAEAQAPAPVQAAPAPEPVAAEAAPEGPAVPQVPIHDLVVRGPVPGMMPAGGVAPAPAEAALPVRVHSLHLRPLVDGWERYVQLLPMVGGDNMTPAARNCMAFMNHELAMLTEEQSQKGAVPPALMAKMKQAVTAFAENRTSDTITLLKNALNGDPHNHSLLSMLSQVLYYMAANGQQTVLPEARENALRSIIYSEKVKPQKLALYRYLAMVTELMFNPERTLEWLRETGFLDPHVLTGKNGILANNGLSLRGWAMLAQVPVSMWGESEFRATKQLLTQVVGGGAIYQMWFRSALVEAHSMSKMPLPEVDEMERLFITSQAFYDESATALRQLPLRSSQFPWFLRARYMNTFAQLVTVPNFDQVLCMVALSGQACMENVFPDAELRTLLDDATLSYWNIWSLVVTPFKDVRQPYLMPAEETVRDAGLLTSCDNLLAALQEGEKQRVKAHIWEDIKPWMTRWQMEHLLAVGTGSNKPRSRFTPNLIPYTHFYRRWQDPLPTSVLASEVIIETARRGSFASLFEIVAAFEGAMRLLDDPVHGLNAGQRRALAAAKKNNPKKFDNVTTDFGGGGGNMMMYLLPVGMLGGMAAIVQLSANWSQAIGLMLALAGLAGVVALNLKK